MHLLAPYTRRCRFFFGAAVGEQALSRFLVLRLIYHRRWCLSIHGVGMLEEFLKLTRCERNAKRQLARAVAGAKRPAPATLALAQQTAATRVAPALQQFARRAALARAERISAISNSETARTDHLRRNAVSHCLCGTNTTPPKSTAAAMSSLLPCHGVKFETPAVLQTRNVTLFSYPERFLAPTFCNSHPLVPDSEQEYMGDSPSDMVVAACEGFLKLAFRDRKRITRRR